MDKEYNKLPAVAKVLAGKGRDMPKKKVVSKKSSKPSISKTGIRNNQFFGLLLIALGLGALIVVVRYFFISLQVPTSVYEIAPSELIPGAGY